jgi:hypothetical protein
MGFTSWAKVRIDTQVECRRPGLEPTAAPLGHRFWLGNPGEAEQAGIKGFGGGLTPGGHGQLHMIESSDLKVHDLHLPAASASRLTWQSARRTASLPHDMGSLIKK